MGEPLQLQLPREESEAEAPLSHVVAPISEVTYLTTKTFVMRRVSEGKLPLSVFFMVVSYFFGTT
jgi:hypothetical protein